MLFVHRYSIIIDIIISVPCRRRRRCFRWWIEIRVVHHQITMITNHIIGWTCGGGTSRSAVVVVVVVVVVMHCCGG
jgi:hypothetical protein